MNKLEKLLKEHGLRTTECRLQTLMILENTPYAVTHAYLEDMLKNDFDRVTIYRTLYSFLDKGIIHKVLDEGGSSKYALCSSCSDMHHQHDHVHFKCERCTQTLCMDEVHLPAFRLPAGYVIKEMGILIQGICKACNQRFANTADN